LLKNEIYEKYDLTSNWSWS